MTVVHVVDDDPAVRDSLSFLLSTAELTPIVYDSAAALLANGHDLEPGCIITDVRMPGMSGLELLEQIKKRYEKPPPVVMMITAYGDQENYNRAIQLGADDFLTKPVDFVSLKEKLKEKLNNLIV